MTDILRVKRMCIQHPILPKQLQSSEIIWIQGHSSTFKLANTASNIHAILWQYAAILWQLNKAELIELLKQHEESWGMLDWYQNKRRLKGVSLAVEMNFSVCQLAVESPYTLPRYHGFSMSYSSERQYIVYHHCCISTNYCSHERPGKFDVSVPCL